MTENYFCQRKQQQASINARNLLDRNASIPEQKSIPDVKNPLIDKKFWEYSYA
jgi:hypothetical protein